MNPWDPDYPEGPKEITVTGSYGPAIIVETCPSCGEAMFGHAKMRLFDEVVIMCPNQREDVRCVSQS